MPLSLLDRPAEPAVAELTVGPAPAPLLVVLREAGDLDGPVAEAARRARAARRPLLVAVVLPPRPLTIDPTQHVLHARFVADLETALTAAVHHRFGHDVRVLPVRDCRGDRHRSTDRLARRIVALARRHGAEVHLSRLRRIRREAVALVG